MRNLQDGSAQSTGPAPVPVSRLGVTVAPPPPDPAGADPLERLLAENRRDLLARLSPAGGLLHVSPSVHAVLGYAPEDLLGRPACDLLHPEDAAAVRRSPDLVPRGPGGGAATLRVRRKDGSYVWLEVEARAHRAPPSGAVIELSVTARDVTERRLGELATAESERRFRAAFEQAAVGMGHYALDGRWLRVNERLGALTGYAVEELLAGTSHGLVHPMDAPAYLESMTRLLQGDLATYQSELRYVRKGGEVTWVQVTASLVRDDDGAPDYFLAVVEDVAHRKRSEEALASMRRELAQMEKLSALGTLVGGVAHEVRTPLAYASNHLYILQILAIHARSRGLTPAELDQFDASVREALEGADRINRLVQDLRRLAKHDAGTRVPSQLNEVVQDALGLFRATHRGAHTVEAVLAPLPPVDVDRVQIQQVVLNLLENAGDAMPPGSVIQLATRALDSEVEIVVRDRGQGIPPEVQGRIFDPLFTTKAHGMGLGLSIVQRIVEAHGGHVTFETKPGVGTTFTVRIPVRAPAGDAAAAGFA